MHELCVKRIHVTKRDLYYTDVKLFEEQASAGAAGGGGGALARHFVFVLI